MNRINISWIILTIVCVATLSAAAFSQEITYQGFLKQNGMPLNGTYDIRLEVYTAATGGQWIFTSNAVNVSVVNGVFASNFAFANPGTDPRWVEVSVRPSGTSTWTNLLPRQLLTWVPLAMNSATLNGINVDGFIRNTGTQQAATNFNIGGTGTANVFNAATQYDLGGGRIVGIGAESVFVGLGAGISNAGGIENAFFGRLAGESNSTGSGNTFVGFIAGRFTTTGTNNSFFGSRVGFNNSTGNFNSFFGHRAGENNNGDVNSFYGTGAGLFNSSGNSNTFIGHDAGNTNSSGSFNTILGENADVSGDALSNATAIGSKALVSQSNSLVLGSINGVNGATADTNVGIGTTSPTARLIVSTAVLADGENTATFRGGTGGHLSHIHFGTAGDWYIRSAVSTGKVILQDTGGNVGIGTTVPNAKLTLITSSDQALRVGGTPASGRLASFGGNGTFLIDDNIGNSGGRFTVLENGNVGIGNSNPSEKLNVNGNVALLLSSGGGTNVCQNAQFRLATCSSSLRYKQNVTSFGSGLALVRRLRPVTFHWKAGNALDMGLVAEEVAEVEPLLVTRNDKGDVEGVKYDRIAVVAVNAIKEQQAEIESLKKANELQQAQIDELKQLVCQDRPTARVCGEINKRK